MNIVMIIIDTLRYDHIAANGNPDVKTPNFDRLAAKSWNFHRAFTASYPTIPHRTDVITGRYGGPFNPWRCLDFELPTLPRTLADLGYCSQLIHDTPHLVNGAHGFDFPFDAWKPIRGAEVDREWITDSWEPLPNWKKDPLFDIGPDDMKEVIRRCHAITGYLHTNRGRTKEEDWNAAKLFTAGAEFLRDNASRNDFFLWLDCFDPHEPWDAPPTYMKMYDKTPGYDGTIDPRSFYIRNDPDLPEAARDRVKAEYKAKVSLVDHWLGVFLDALEETGLDENTAVLLTADHGTNLGDQPGQTTPHFGKTVPQENEHHVPFMVSVPGGGSGESQILVQPQDVYATLLGIVGEGQLPEGVESFDVLASVREGGNGPRSIAVGGRGVRTWSGKGLDEQLFSAFDQEWYLGVTADPTACRLQRLGTGEDVAADHPDVVERLRTAAIAEIARRGLDPEVVAWLQSEGQKPFPETFKATDAKPAPKGWHAGYWRNLYTSLGLPE